MAMSVHNKRGKSVSALGLAALALLLQGSAALAQVVPPATQPADGGLNPDSFYGKEPTEGVYVRDSAGAVEKLALAQRMERLGEWAKSSDLYQEVLSKYADRVVQSKLDADHKICQYMSITNPVQERLAHWPAAGLDAYRGRFEAVAQAMLDKAGTDDIATLHRVYTQYFVTDAGRQAGIRLMDIDLENGEYPAAAWLGERLLNLHPGLGADRPLVLYRTALAFYYAGEADKAKERLAQLKTQFPNEHSLVRGKDVVLADSLASEMQAPVADAQSASADSWPVPFGDNSRGRISTADGKAGAHLYNVALSAPVWSNVNAQVMGTVKPLYESAVEQGQTIGILPVTDRGELFFQDGLRVYALSIDSGMPLPGWAQSYPDGAFVLPGVWGSPRAHQLTLALTDRQVIGIMGYPDPTAANAGVQQSSEARLVCLDRQNGQQKWTVALGQLPEEAKEARTLQFSGSPLVVGDTVLVMARGSKNQFEDCYVLAFDLATGKHLWSTYVASASNGAAAFNGMAGPAPISDNASTMAYANGRIYVQSNLGALAALDPYNGAVIWLDIYPTGRADIERQQFQRMGMGASDSLSEQRKPWTFNPVIVQDGYVFSLPTEGKNLLIYDAASGTEIKRINLKEIEDAYDELSDLQTLVGVNGDRVLVAGEKGLIYLNWKDYAREADGTAKADKYVVWIQEGLPPLRGRPFMTRDTIYVPTLPRLFEVSLSRGRITTAYPMDPVRHIYGDFQKPEEAGNVLVTNDHVIIAGALDLNVYTDLTLEKARLDRELAAAPADPRPRLRYAEIDFIAGDPDAAMARLDEAQQRLDGPANDVDRDRFFNDALGFGDKLSAVGEEADRNRAVPFFDRAREAAATPVQQVRYRLSRAKFADRQNSAVEAVTLYEQILSDGAMRAVAMIDPLTGAPTQANLVAEGAITRLMKAHPGVYESFEQTAASQMQAAMGADADKADKLLTIARVYPNSTVAGKAMLAAASAYEGASAPRSAIRVLRDMWYKYPQSPDKATILESIARNYLSLAAMAAISPGDRGPMDNLEAAATALARAVAISDDAKTQAPLVLRDGGTIDVGTPLARALEKVRQVRVSAASASLPDLHVKIPPPHVPGQAPQPPEPAFSPPAADRDVVGAIKKLLLPIGDFSRPDRVIALAGGAASSVQIFAAMQTKPLATTAWSGDEPRACAWVGEQALLWGGSQLSSMNGTTGAVDWTVDLRQIASTDVVRMSDSAVSLANIARNPDDLPMNRRMQRRFGPRVGFVQPPALPMVAPPPARAGAPEQLVDVRPVGDHVVLTTSTGRLLSVLQSTGAMVWQTRMSDRQVDRLVANDDFTVVRVSDETTVRLAVFDTATGQMRCTRSWASNSGMFPVNLALAADGTLVYTLPDRLCIKDLYKPWTDDSEISVPSAPATAVFMRATQPDQLLISEGRILALANDGAMWNIRVHSLETGQPVPMHYKTADGNKEVDRILTAGRSDQISLRIVGPHLYVVNPTQIIHYNLDRPEDSWSQDEADDPHFGAPLIRDAFITKTFVAILALPSPDDEEANPPADLVVNPTPLTAPVKEYRVRLYGRRLGKRNQESGRQDYDQKVADPAGITPQWQVVEGGFYYLAADNKLHVLRGGAE